MKTRNNQKKSKINTDKPNTSNDGDIKNSELPMNLIWTSHREFLKD